MIVSAVRDPYPTRDKVEGALIRRAEPVVYSQWAEGAPLTQAQTEQFERDGYLVLTDVFSAHELDQLRAASERLAKVCRGQYDEKLLCEPGSDQLRTLFGIHEVEGLLKSTASNRHILDVIEFLLNDEVYIHQSRLNFKSPQYGSGFEWHSDFETWHAEDGMPGMRAISATVLLTDEVSADGSLKFMPKSHKTFVACPGETPDNSVQEAFKKQAVGKPPALFLDLLEEHGGIEEVVAPAGSVLLFDCNVMHGAGKNTSEFLRANLYYVYNAVSNALNAPYAADEPRPEFMANRQFKALRQRVVDERLQAA
ncbi:phytanoyl-CoA dioxygenase family protein [Limnobacter sp.]|uniref:phytanoyl-CoA dioxygenase family protein n=1 Tax=Limnobacter sp. TaxID=2003368 RepID=UPI003512DF05